MKRNLWKIFLCFTLSALSFFCLFSACNSSQHIHKYTTLIHQDPTCAESGFEYTVCDCGKRRHPGFTSSISPLGHDIQGGVCARCHQSESQGLSFAQTEEGYALIGRGECQDEHLILPKSADGVPVVAVKESAFEGDSIIKSVHVPYGYKWISNDAFKNCKNLVYAFIPYGVEYYELAFNFSSSLCIHNENQGFNNRTEHEEYDYVVHDGQAFLMKYKGKAGNVVIPNELGGYPVTKIGGIFQRNKKLTSIVIPEGVTEIELYSFSDCTNLYHVELPSTLQRIGRGAFGDCINLVEIVNRSPFLQIEKQSTEHGYIGVYAIDVYNATDEYVQSSLSKDGDFLYYTKDGEKLLLKYDGNSLQTDVLLPEGITRIYKFAFYQRYSLTSVTFPNSLKTVDTFAFYECVQLRSIYIPSGVETVRYHAFCELENVTFYCADERPPSTWDEQWNYHNYPVIWGYTAE